MADVAVGQEIEGHVKRFDAARGWGFLEPDGGGPDVFVHHSALMMEGYRTLSPGQRVRFVIADSPRGRLAVNVKVIPDA